MSRTVTGYQDGHPIYRDDGPAYARPAGFGGSALGHFTGTVFQVGPSKAVRTATQLRRLEMKRAAKARRRISQKGA